MIADIRGRNVLITGAARGIGESIALRFAAAGANIAITYVNSEAAATALAKRMETDHHVKTMTMQANLSRTSEATKVVEGAIAGLGGLDIIISCGGDTKRAFYEDIYALDEEDWDHAWNLFVKSNVWLLRAAKPTFDANEHGGCIICMSSIGGQVNNGSSMAYSVARAAENHLVRGLAKTQGPKIRVNAVAPGLVETDRAKEFFPEEMRQIFRDMAILKRTTEREEVAEMFLQLAQNEGMTGQIITVDCGLVL